MPDTLLGGIAINEFLVDPTSATNNFDTDGNGAARGRDEFIELVNTSNAAIDISGLELWDQGRDNWFTFPPGTILQAGAVAVVVRDVQNGGSLPAVTGDNLAFDAAFGSGVFNNNGDNIVVYDPANDEYIQATYNGDPQLDPATSAGFDGFSATATRSGLGEDFGSDIDGISLQRLNTGFTNNQTPTPGSLLCFIEGSLIETDTGFQPIETLRAGDRVRTLDAGFQQIVWVFGTPVSASEMQHNAALRPITLSALPGLPPLTVSRQHRVLVSGKPVERMFGTPSVLAPVKDLTPPDEGGARTTTARTRYFHILLEKHHILNANGYAAESLFNGPEAQRSLSQAALANIKLAENATAIRVLSTQVAPARVLVSGAKARRLAFRLRKNGLCEVSPFGALGEGYAPARPASVMSNRHVLPPVTAQHATSRDVAVRSTST